MFPVPTTVRRKLQRLAFRCPSRRSYPLACFAGAMIALCSMWLQAADDVLRIVPDVAYGVAYVQGLEQVSTKFGRVAELAGQPAPDLLELAKLSSGLEQGVNTKGTLAVALLPGADGAPTPVLFVAVSDYAAVLKQLEPGKTTDGISEVNIADQEALVAKKDDFALMVRSGDRAVLTNVLNSQRPFSESVESLRGFLRNGDVGVVVSRSGIGMAMTESLKFLEIVKAQVAAAGPETQTAVAGLSVYETLFKAIKDGATHFAVALRIDQQGTIRLSTRTLLDPKTGIAEIADKTRRGSQHPLRGLPPEPYVVAFGGPLGMLTDQMMDWSMGMLKNMSPPDQPLSEEKLKQLAEAGRASMQGVRSMNMVMSVGKEGEPLYSRMYFRFQTDDAQAFLKSYEKSYRTMSEITKDGAIPLYGEMELQRVTVERVPALKLTMAMEVPGIPGADEAQLKEMYQKMFGGDKIEVYIAAADKTTVVGAYTSPKQLAHILRAAQSGGKDLSKDAQTEAAANMLADDAQWVMFVSLSGVVDFVKQAAAIFAPTAPVPPIPEFPASPPLAFSTRLDRQGVETQMAVSSQTIKAIGEFITAVQLLQGGLE